MKLKICGLRNSDNVAQLSKLHPAMIGFIFYEPSPRHVSVFPTVDVPSGITKVGVFVNEPLDRLISTMEENDLDVVQLHGKEDPEYCRCVVDAGYEVMKAFSVYDRFEFDVLKHYAPYVKYFLFDARGEAPGGNGVRFDWNVLKKYDLDTPYFLSGGIGPDDAQRVNERFNRDPRMIGVDVNSKFEIEPGLKDVEQLKEFKAKLHDERKLRVVR